MSHMHTWGHDDAPVGGHMVRKECPCGTILGE